MKSDFTWKQAMELNLRSIRMFYAHFPKIMWSRLFCAVWESITPFVGIFLSALLIKEIAGNRDPQRMMYLILLTLLTTVLISVVKTLLFRWRNIEMGGSFQRVWHILSQKLLDMDYADVERTDTHTQISKIVDCQKSGTFGFWHVLSGFEVVISSLCTIIGGIALTVSLFTSPIPSSAGAFVVLGHPIFLVALIFIMIGVTYLSPALLTKSRQFFANNLGFEALSNRMMEFYGLLGNKADAASDMRIYRQDKICDQHNSDKTSAFHSKGVFARLSKGSSGAYRAASGAVSVVFAGIAYLYVCLKAWAGAFGVGEVTQYVAAITKVASGVSQLIAKVGELRTNAPFLQFVFEFLDIPNAMYQGTIPVEKRNDNEYEIAFHNVSFKYPGSENYALKDVSFRFKVGQRLAVVGMNGSGKTTMIKLLCRLYDPTEGHITLNGIDIRKYDYLEYLSVFSVVFQDFKLFSFELGENVAGGTEYDADRVRDCLVKAGLGERLKELPNGLHTYLYKDFDKEGVDVSGGEAQKIAIARALYKDAPFIILDEPTAALDPIAEAEIYSKFNEIVGDKTAIYISHRLSSCRFCDEIVVFDHGAVIQQGSHDALLADEAGKYHELWYAQAQYYV